VCQQAVLFIQFFNLGGISMKKQKKLRMSEALKKSIQQYSDKYGMAHYKIAAQANVSPNILSYLLNGVMLFNRDDARIKRIAKIVKFKKECFEK